MFKCVAFETQLFPGISRTLFSAKRTRSVHGVLLVHIRLLFLDFQRRHEEITAIAYDEISVARVETVLIFSQYFRLFFKLQIPEHRSTRIESILNSHVFKNNFSH